MKFLLSSRHRLQHERDEIPFHYRSYHVPGAQPLYVKGDFGDYLTQIIPFSGCEIQLNLSRTIKKTYLYLLNSLPVFSLHFMLKGSVRCNTEDHRDAWLRENCYNLFYLSDNLQHRIQLAPNSYHSFHLNFSRGFLRMVTWRYPEVADGLSRFFRNSVTEAQQHDTKITPRIKSLIDKIIPGSSSTISGHGISLPAMAFRLLLMYIQDHIMEEELPPNVQQLMEDIKAYILSHLHEPLSVPSLAADFFLTKSTLRRQFLQFTGEPVHHFMIIARMEKAARLLEQGLHVGDVALQTGYKDNSSFTRAFIRFFGYPPSKHRKH